MLDCGQGDSAGKRLCDRRQGFPPPPAPRPLGLFSEWLGLSLSEFSVFFNWFIFGGESPGRPRVRRFLDLGQPGGFLEQRRPGPLRPGSGSR